jgi:hypothetical protein
MVGDSRAMMMMVVTVQGRRDHGQRDLRGRLRRLRPTDRKRPLSPSPTLEFDTIVLTRSRGAPCPEQKKETADRKAKEQAALARLSAAHG